MLSGKEKALLVKLGYNLNYSGDYLFKTITTESPIRDLAGNHKSDYSTIFINCEDKVVSFVGLTDICNQLLNELRIYISGTKLEGTK